jgi:hypothetical protein
MKNILNRGFSQLGNSELVTKIQLIISQLTGNPILTLPNTAFTAVQSGLATLEGALALTNPQARKAGINAARPPLEQALDDLADDLETAANNDPAALATTGFDLRKATSSTSEAPSQPQNVRLRRTGNSGEAQVICDASERARGYQIQTTDDPNSGIWKDYDTFSSSRNMIIKGFPRAKDLWVRVRAIGPNNTKSVWSDPATILME